VCDCLSLSIPSLCSLAEKTAARESLLKKLTPLFRVKSRERKRESARVSVGLGDRGIGRV